MEALHEASRQGRGRHVPSRNNAVVYPVHVALSVKAEDNGPVQSREGFVTLLHQGCLQRGSASRRNLLQLPVGIFSGIPFVGKAGDFHHEAALPLQVVCKPFQLSVCLLRAELAEGHIRDKVS